MADFTTQSKSGIGDSYPENALESVFSRLEPIITPDQVRSYHLFGIPLVSFMADPITNRRAIITNEMIAEFIEKAIATAEGDCHIDIFPTQYDEAHDYDRNLYQSFGYFKTRRRPVSSIQSITVQPADGTVLYNVDLTWVNVSQLVSGQINIMPLTMTIGSTSASPQATPANQTAGAAVFLSLFSSYLVVSSFWHVKYTTGFKDAKVPRVLNELIGTICAMEVLSMLGATYARTTSTSLGVDGLSQAISTPGPQIFVVRLEALAEKRARLTKQIKAIFGMSVFSSNI